MIWDTRYKMRCKLSTPGSPEYIPPVTPSISATPVSPYAPVTQSVSIIPVSPYTRRSSVLCQVDWWWWWETDFPATADVQLHIIDANLSERLEEAKKFPTICILNVSLAAKVKHLQAVEPVQDGQSRKLAAAQQVVEWPEEELQIEIGRSAWNLRWESSTMAFNNLHPTKCRRLRRPIPPNRPQAQPCSVAPPNWPLAHMVAMAAQSSCLIFWCMKANEPWMMSPPAMLLCNVTSRMQPEPLDVPAQWIGVSR